MKKIFASYNLTNMQALIVELCVNAIRANSPIVNIRQYHGWKAAYVILRKKDITVALDRMLNDRHFSWMNFSRNLDMVQSCNPVLRYLNIPEI